MGLLRRLTIRIKQTNRRGSVLVLVALMLGVFMAIAAIGADIGRFYVVASELQTGADAAALMGASVLQRTTSSFETTVDDSVTSWASHTNRADGASLTIARDSITVGYWMPGASGAAGTFTSPTPAGLTPNAVMVSAAGNPRGVFSQLIGRTTGLPMSRRAIAWIGKLSLNCTRPWSLQYRPLVQAVNGDADTTQELDMTKFVAYQNQSESQRTMVIHNEESTGSPPADDGVWNAYNLPSGANGGANSGQSTYQDQIVNCNNIALNADAANGNLQPSNGVGGCGYGTIVCWTMDVISGQSTGQADRQGPGICGTFAAGDATCWDKAGTTAGVVIDVAYANKVGNGSGAIDFKYVGETKLLCFFKSTTDVCNAIPAGRPKTGYTPGTLVVVAQGLKSRTLNPTDIVSNSPTNVQRLFLVK
jgi:Flp pilus assembly protein TadG